MQLWIAQPTATRHGAAAFEHHPELPHLDLGAGSVATVLAGGIAGAYSPARRDSDLVGADLDLRSPVVIVPLEARFEHAVVVLSGAVLIGGHAIAPGHLGYLGSGRDELRVSAQEPTRALLLGGAPLDEPVLMWWNFVARTRAEIDDAYRDWSEHTDRFGPVASPLPRIGVGPPPWQHPSS